MVKVTKLNKRWVSIPYTGKEGYEGVCCSQWLHGVSIPYTGKEGYSSGPAEQGGQGVSIPYTGKEAKFTLLAV